MTYLNITYDDFNNKLSGKGYEFLGKGCFAEVFKHKKKKRAIKVCIVSDRYIHYAEKVKKIKNKYFPRVYSIKKYKDCNGFAFTVIETELLKPITRVWGKTLKKTMSKHLKKDVDKHNYNLDGYFKDFNYKRKDYSKELKEAIKVIMELRNKVPAILDMHPHNVMLRKTQKGYDVVFSDPLC